MNKLRKCMYQGKVYYFHLWFQEGNMENGIDVGAVLEDENGKTSKVWEVSDIEFISKEG